MIHVTTTDESLEYLLAPQLKAFQAAGYEVLGASASGPYRERLEGRGIRHVELRGATRTMAPHRDILALIELARLFRRLRPEIVHTHNPKPGLYGRVAARLSGVPIVVNTVHGLYTQPGDRWRRRLPLMVMERVASTCSDAELVQNPEDLSVLREWRVPRAKLTLLGNGVDLERFDPTSVTEEDRRRLRDSWGVDDRHVVVLTVGRLVREKGYRELIEAARMLAEQGSPVRWVVAGGSDPAKADALSESELAEGRRHGVTWLGHVDDVRPLYAAADIFALPSYREGYPRSAMEAHAMGLPIVATSIRGCRQVVEDGVTGLLVPVRDAGALGRAVGVLAADPDRRRSFGASGRSRSVALFDQDEVIARTLRTYARLLGVAFVGGPRGNPPSPLAENRDRGTP